MSQSLHSSKIRPLRDYLTWQLLLGGMVLTLLATLMSLWRPRLLGDLINRLVDGDLPVTALFLGVGIYLGIALLGAVFSKWMRQLPMRWGPMLSHRLRVRLHDHLFQLDENQIHDQRVGELMSRLQSDVNAVAEMLSLGGHSLIRAAFTLGLAFYMMYQRSSALALVLTLLLPLLMLIAFVMMHSIRFRHLKVQEQLGLISSFCQESFGGLRILRGLGLGSRRIEKFSGLNEEYIARNLSLSRIEIFAWPLIHSGFVLGNVLLLWVGGRQVIRGEMQIGMLVEFQQYLMILQWPSLSIAWTLSLILRGRASLGRLQEVIDTLPQIHEDSGEDGEAVPSQAPIVFDQVGLVMNGQRVLNRISFSYTPGTLLGITGATGSGKTLLMQLLLRRQDPDEGRILLGGRPLSEWSLDQLYENCRIAPQEPVLFSMTLEENLKLAMAEVSPEQLQRALTLSALDQDLAQLSEGLQTRIGERGVTLSGGQRQRCAIARALLGDPALLLLDDSLSAVDSATEAMILSRLLPARRGRGLWMVSHRYAALRHCDQVLVLADGEIIEAGTPDALLQANGPFAELAERQRLQAALEVEDE